MNLIFVLSGSTLLNLMGFEALALIWLGTWFIFFLLGAILYE